MSTSSGTGYQEIPPRSQGNVTARITLLSTSEPQEDSVVEARQLKPGLYVGRTLLPKRHRDVKVTVANTTNKPQPISPGNSLGQILCVTVLPEKTGSIESTDCQEPALDIIKSTLEQVRRRGFWFGWRRDVQRFCRQC